MKTLRSYLFLGFLAYSFIKVYGVELNYKAMIARSDPWGYVNKIPRTRPNEFWLSIINNNKEYLKLKDKMDHPTKLYLQAANDYAYDRNRGILYYNLQQEYNLLGRNEITDSLTKILAVL